MVPGGMDFYSEQEAEGSRRAARWKQIKFVICSSCSRRLNLRLVGTGRRCEGRRGLL